MEKGANIVLISLLALFAILIVFLVIEFEHLDVSLQDGFNWITINSTTPQEYFHENKTDMSKINNTKPVLIKPSESVKPNDVSHLFPEPFDQNWDIQNLFDYSDYDFGWGIQEMQERYYYNKEKPLMVQVAISRVDNEKNAVILFDYEKNLLEQTDQSTLSYNFLEHDNDAVTSIDADNCLAVKMQSIAGNSTVFVVQCQKEEFYYTIYSEAFQIELPENLAIEFAKKVSSKIS